MKTETGRDRTSGAAPQRFLAMAIAAPLLLEGCTGANIWNAGDLAVWVRDRAVDQGCRRETIELEEWYTTEAEGNVWQGTCLDVQGNTKSFGVNVDAVWKPSRPAA